MNYQYIASGVKTDCQKLLERFTATGSVRFKEFVKIWKDMKFPCIYSGRESFAGLYEFTEEVRVQVKQEDRGCSTRKNNSILPPVKRHFYCMFLEEQFLVTTELLKTVYNAFFYLSHVICCNFREVQLTVINYSYDRNKELFLMLREVSHVHVNLRNLA